MINDYEVVASCIRRTAQRDLDDLFEKKVIKAVAKSQTDPTKNYVLLRQWAYYVLLSSAKIQDII